MASKNSSGESYGKGRTRNWNFLIWIDSAPENWRDIIDEEHIEWFESPLHEFDKNPDGSNKKPHWHITAKYESVKTFDQVKFLTDKLHTTIPQICKSIKGSVRYMAHLDNPDKYQYSVADIKAHGGADLVELLRPTSSERYQLIGEMMDYVRDQNIVEMEDLLYYARTKRFDDWFPLLCDNSSYVMGSMIKSRRHRVDKSVLVIKVDSDGTVVEDEKKGR